mgnify:CR=1 FL=1
MNYAGFGKRLFAYLIGGVTIGLAGGILAVFFGYYFYLIFGWLLGALYFILMEGGTWQATLGKRAMGLIVTDMNGDPISYGTATLRYLGKFVSSLILGDRKEHTSELQSRFGTSYAVFCLKKKKN